MLHRIERALGLELVVLEWLQVPFLTAVRLYWGWAFATNGWGKLHNLDKIAAWFGGELHIPMPYANAVAAASTEFLGGVFLLLGLGGRVATIPLVVVMCVAYLTSDFGSLQSLWHTAAACSALPECQPFEDGAPFSFLMAATIVLLFGPGPLSLDAVIARWWARKA